MARKRSSFGTLFTLGGLAAAGAAIYKNRDTIRGFINELVGNVPGAETADVEISPEAYEVRETETDIVIDHSGDAGEEN